jgi:hypothetical protein
MDYEASLNAHLAEQVRLGLIAPNGLGGYDLTPKGRYERFMAANPPPPVPPVVGLACNVCYRPAPCTCEGSRTG